MVEAIKPGLVGEARTMVDATPAMVGLMEHAAINAVEHLLPEGSVSVGTHLDVRHLAATPPGLEVRARAELVEVEGRRLAFRVEAFDPVEKIGEGAHERFVVELARLVSRAEGKAK